MMHDLLCALPDWLIGHILVGTTRPRRRQESALYFNANTDAILLLVVLNALFANWGGGLPRLHGEQLFWMTPASRRVPPRGRPSSVRPTLQRSEAYASG
jgi:hypothetical protein